jgi:hypothetical protein
MFATTESTSMSFSEVSSLLWQEREALELLLFKLVEERLIVASGETRWLAPANREIESVVAQLRGIEVVRAAEVDVVAGQLGREDALTLSELASLADEPWRGILTEHREVMLGLVVQIEQAADENRKILGAGARAVRETLLAMTESVDTYDARGVTSQTAPRPMIVDEQA